MRSSLERLVQVRDAAPRNSHDAPNIAGDSRTASRAQLPAAKPLATRRSTPNLLLPVRIVAKPEGEMLAAKATHIDGMRVTRQLGFIAFQNAVITLFEQRRSFVYTGILVPSTDFLIKELITVTLKLRMVLHSCMLVNSLVL